METSVANRVFIDTLFLVALINTRDPYHDRAKELAFLLESRPLLITDAVLLELGNALSKNHREAFVKLVETFLGSDQVAIVRLSPSLFDDALALYRSSRDKAWGMVDCLSFVAMRREKVVEVLTSDRHFTQAGFRTLMGGPSNGRGHSAN
jgi:predicted nucleic acid-binding protein